MGVCSDRAAEVDATNGTEHWGEAVRLWTYNRRKCGEKGGRNKQP